MKLKYFQDSRAKALLFEFWIQEFPVGRHFHLKIEVQWENYQEHDIKL